MGKMSIMVFHSLVYFYFFEALDAFEVQFFFQGLILNLIKDIDSMYGHAAHIFNMETLLHSSH